MNDIKKANREKLLNRIIQVAERKLIIERPNVAIELILYTANPPANSKLIGRGFAKVAYPDKWDASFGIALATKKAASQIVRIAKSFNVDLSYLV